MTIDFKSATAVAAEHSPLAFSLTCYDCDAGMDVTTPEQADLTGWTRVLFYGKGLGWNYVGLCPQCREGDTEP